MRTLLSRNGLTVADPSNKVILCKTIIAMDDAYARAAPAPAETNLKAILD